MTVLAPNLSVLLGSSCAAKLMATAGGLYALSKIPACNLQVIGKSGKYNSAAVGMSSLHHYKHGGIIYYSEIASTIPSEYRPKATKIIAAKYVFVYCILLLGQHWRFE
jgi:U4/U6 small nuclear ribonucleoprotein PRP31